MTALRVDATRDSRLRLRLLSLLVPLLLWAAMASLLGDWIIDDAGITFAYAKHLAAGSGLVAQAGRAPVEGYSDFLWLLVQVPLFAAHLFTPLVAARLVPALFMLLAFERLQRMLRHETGRALPGFILCVLLALSPPLAIWCASGLENSLMLFLLAAFLERAVLRPRGWRLHAGLLAALMAMTHPEGIAYLASGLFLSLLSDESDDASQRNLSTILRESTSYIVGFSILFVPFFVMRLVLFGLPLPQTYYAKRRFFSFADRARDLLAHPRAAGEKLLALSHGVAGPLGPLIFGLVALLVIWLCAKKKTGRALVAGLAFLIVGVATFIWLDDDWMGEFRFATVAIAAFALVAVLSIDRLASLLSPRFRRAAFIAAAALGLSALPDALSRTIGFAEDPPTPFFDIDRQVVKRFDAYAELLHLEDGSLLIADVGAPLLNSRLRIFDLAGLTEPAITRTLKGDTEYWLALHPAFYDWVFETAKPTFISTNAFWTQVTALERDPRLLRDYVFIDAFEDAWALRSSHRSIHSGVLVRRDAMPPGDLERLQKAVVAPPREEPLIERLLGVDSYDLERLQREARADFESQKFAPAASRWARVVARQPVDLEARHQLASALDNAGRSNEGRHEWQELLERARAVGEVAQASAAETRLGTSTPESDLERSFGLVQSGRFLEASDAACAALQKDPRSGDAWNNLAIAWAGMRMWGLAGLAITQALQLQPESQLAKNNLVWIFQEKQKAAVAKVPAPDAPTPLLYLNLSAQLALRGRYRECIAAAKEASALDRTLADAFNNEAACNESLQNWDEAIRAAGEALRLQPDFPLAKNNLAWSLEEKSRTAAQGAKSAADAKGPKAATPGK